MERLSGEKLLGDLALELDAVGAVLGHGLSSFESPARGQSLSSSLSGPRGPLQIHTRTVAESLEAVFESSDVEHFV